MRVTSRKYITIIAATFTTVLCLSICTSSSFAGTVGYPPFRSKAPAAVQERLTAGTPRT
jgi:hypothetical protein